MQFWYEMGLAMIEEREVQAFSCIFMGCYVRDEGNHL